MSRWSWHDTSGLRKGPILRSSDTYGVTEMESAIQSRHQREWTYQHTHPQTPLYVERRTCAICGANEPQIRMRWSGNFRRWLCAKEDADIVNLAQTFPVALLVRPL